MAVQGRLAGLQNELLGLMHRPDIEPATARERSAEILQAALKAAGPHLEHSPGGFYQRERDRLFPSKKSA